MSTYILHSNGAVAPLLVDGWATSQESRNNVHQVLGSSLPLVSLKPATLRTGTLSMFFLDAAEAEGARQVFCKDEAFQLYIEELPGQTMHFVANGAVNVRLEDELRRHWFVEVDFQEIVI